MAGMGTMNPWRQNKTLEDEFTGIEKNKAPQIQPSMFQIPFQRVTPKIFPQIAAVNPHVTAKKSWGNTSRSQNRWV